MSNITIRYNVTGAERKRLADYIAGFLGCEKKYLGVPSCAYRVGFIEVSKDGAITFDERAESEDTKALLAELEQEGFHAEPAEDEQFAEKPEENADSETLLSEQESLQEEPIGLTVSIPLDKVAVGNLTNLLDAKGSLIKKALGLSELPIAIGEDAVSFPWFSLSPDADSAKAYTDFIAALCRMSKEQKRISATEKEVPNEKYAFRCFLLRLGFIGVEYKQDRKILLQNLTGSSAFKTMKEAGADEISE